MKKKARALALLTTTALFASIPALAYGAGWEQDEQGYWYELEDGSYPADAWMEIDGSWYHFDEKGYMQTGWYRDGRGRRFWLGGDGKMLADRICKLDGAIYSIDTNGYCTQRRGYTGWVQEGDRWWYQNSRGTWPKSCWQQIRGEWYRFDGDGYMLTGWFEEDGARYWMDASGKMLRDTTRMIDGVNYSFDASGAASQTVKAPVVIPPEEQKTEMHKTVDAMADQILAGIITPDMNDHQKAAAIYRWVRGHMTYSGGTGSIGDWPSAAYEGFRRRRGHCYTYYATSLALLSRAGIPSVEVIRATDNDHWWNLVYVDGEWLHFDTTPRRLGGDFCLLTTAQLLAYSNTHGNSHVFDPSQYPATP